MRRAEKSDSASKGLTVEISPLPSSAARGLAQEFSQSDRVSSILKTLTAVRALLGAFLKADD